MVSGSRRFLMKISLRPLFLLLLASACVAQQAPASSEPKAAESKPASDTKTAQAAPRKVDKASAYYHYALAHMYEEQVAMYGRTELANKAIEEYRQAIDADPTSEYLTAGLAELYAKTGRIRDAVMEAQDILKRDPNNLEAHKLLGRIYLRSLGDIQSGNGSQNVLKLAIEQYEQIIKIEPDSVDDHLLLGRLYKVNNDLQKAESEFKTALKLQPDSEDAQTYVRIAEIYRRSGKFDLALENLKKAQSMVPDSIDVPYNLARVYQAQGRYDDAAQILQDLLKKTEKPDNNYTQAEKNNRSVFLELLGSVYRDNNNSQLAIETFRKMLTLGDENAERGYQQIIDTYREARQWQQATDTAKEAVQKLPNDRGLKMVYASQLADMGQAEAGLQQVKALLEGKPEDREVYITLAQMYSRLKRWPDAQESLDKAEQVSSKPEDKQYVYFLRGSMYERQKKYDQAEEMFRKVLSTDPDNATALNYLGYMLADRGVKLEEALNYIKKAVNLDPANGAYLDSLGWAYFRLGKYELAEDNLLKASQKINTDPTVHDHLGDLYQKTGRLKLAATNWERALIEWNRTVAAEVDPADQARVQRKLDSAKMKLAREEGAKR